MADRYWVGGTGTWNTSTTTNWSATSGGAGGASVPTSADIVIFDGNSNTGTTAFTVTISVTANCLDLTFGGAGGVLDGVMTLAGTGTLNIYGSMTLVSTNLSITCTGLISFVATTTGKTVTTAGQTMTCDITFNGVGGTWQLLSNLTLATVTRTITLTNGTFDANGYNVTAGIFDSANSNTRALKLGSGTWNIIGSDATATAWNLGTTTGMTLTPGTATINMSSATAKTFAGGGLTYPILNQGGTGALTITGSNTFNTIINTTQPATVSFTAATTTTVTNFMLSGISGSLITIGSVTAASHTISVPIGVVEVNYCTISRSTATGGATFRASTSNGCVDGLNNSGWIFTSLSNSVGTMLAFFP